MAALSVQQITKSGLTASFASAAEAGDYYPAAGDGREVIEIVNGSASPITLTIAAQGACSLGVSNAAHDITVTIAAGVRKHIRVPAQGYRDSNGRVQLTYSDHEDVSLAVLI